jgi:RimJ/RimL family protein N-acetyltransferase
MHRNRLLGQFQEFLDHPSYLKLVACVEEEPVAIGGIGPIAALRSFHVWLTYGMVRPAFQRQGIGTAMLLARLAALPRPLKPVRVTLSSVPASERFLARFGFVHQGQMRVPPGDLLLDVKAAMLRSGLAAVSRTDSRDRNRFRQPATGPRHQYLVDATQSPSED